MVSTLFILIIWFLLLILCYYIIRPFPNKFVRIVLIICSCIFVTHISSQNLLPSAASSILTIAACWLISIRLIHLAGFSTEPSLTFRSYLFKSLWVFFPILPKNEGKNQWSIISHIILIVIKILINHWIYRWSIRCGTRVTGEGIYIFFMSMMTISYITDAEMVLVRILSGDQYTLESYTNFPLLSLSLREFWGRRYNQLVNTVLKESIFEPIRAEFLSRTIGGMTTFIISGLLHAHLSYVVFDDSSLSWPAFKFFVLHGIACWFETKANIQFPEHVALLVTHTFLLITAPLMLKPFMQEGSTFLMTNPPPLLDAKYIPQLPLPNFCPY